MWQTIKIRTAAFVAAKQTTAEELAVGIDGGTHFLSVSTRTHSINMHFILGRDAAEELVQPRPVTLRLSIYTRFIERIGPTAA